MGVGEPKAARARGQRGRHHPWPRGQGIAGAPDGRWPLRERPAGWDRYGRPTFEVRQEKGLAEVTSHELTGRATEEGYTIATDHVLNAEIERQVAAVSGGRQLDIVEIGGGTGWFFDRLDRHARTYVNVEPSDVELDEGGLARSRDARYLSVRCSAEALPFEPSSFDLALSLASLDHIPDHRRAISEVARCMRAGGYFLVELNNSGSWWKRAMAGTDLLRRRRERIAREHFFQWNVRQCVTELSEHFRVVDARTFTFFPYVPIVWRIALPLADAVVGRLVPSAGGNMFVLCRKGTP